MDTMKLKIINIPATVPRPIGNVVILHGWGANAADAASFATLMELPNINLFLPEGPCQHPYSDDGRMWYGLPEPLSDFRFDADISDHDDLAASRRSLLDWLQNLPAQTGIPLDRTILGGFSQGGAMAFDLGLALPLAGIMGLSGYLHKSLTGISSQTPTALMVHGKADPVVPFAASQFAQTALAATGLTIDYHAYDQMGHEISWDVIALMRDFVQRQLAAAP
jgi:phospholipase/carboxylesterase